MTNEERTEIIEILLIELADSDPYKISFIPFTGCVKGYIDNIIVISGRGRITVSSETFATIEEYKIKPEIFND